MESVEAKSLPAYTAPVRQTPDEIEDLRADAADCVRKG